MKKFLVFFIATLLITACAKQLTDEDPTDKWNGYFSMLKNGQVTHNLLAGQYILVGTVDYNFVANSNGGGDFTVTYNCTGGWMMTETHMYAGDYKGETEEMPVNKPGNPKIGHFPNAADHGTDGVSAYTYTVPLTTLPPAGDPGFVVASHAIVEHETYGEETAWAWAEGSKTFSGKSWGWYDDTWFDTEDNPCIIVYGIEYDNTTLNLYIIDMTNGGSILILCEEVGTAPGPYDGTAYDPESGNFFFVDYTTNELMINPLNDDADSYSIGTLSGPVISAAFNNGSYYYIEDVEGASNTINEVTFDTDWSSIQSNDTISTILSVIAITDIAMDPLGDSLYMVGNVGDGTTELISWAVSTNTYYTISLPLNENTQIAFGSDGELYAVSPTGDSGDGSDTYIIHTDTGTVEEINDEVEIPEDPFGGMSSGPPM